MLLIPNALGASENIYFMFVLMPLVETKLETSTGFVLNSNAYIACITSEDKHCTFVDVLLSQERTYIFCVCDCAHVYVAGENQPWEQTHRSLSCVAIPQCRLSDSS